MPLSLLKAACGLGARLLSSAGGPRLLQTFPLPICFTSPPSVALRLLNGSVRLAARSHTFSFDLFSFAL